MSDEKYIIEVSESKVEITGTLTIREAFDFLSFFEKEGYTTLEDWGERTTLYLRKRDIEKERNERINNETLEDLKLITYQYEQEKEKSNKLNIKVNELESMIKTLMMDESERVKSLKLQISNLEKFKSMQKLKECPEIAEMMKVEGFEGEQFNE